MTWLGYFSKWVANFCTWKQEWAGLYSRSPIPPPMCYWDVGELMFVFVRTTWYQYLNGYIWFPTSIILQSHVNGDFPTCWLPWHQAGYTKMLLYVSPGDLSVQHLQWCWHGNWKTVLDRHHPSRGSFILLATITQTICHQVGTVAMWSEPRPIPTSIKLKIDWWVRAGLLESEFDWLSQIPYWEMWVIFSTDQLLNKSTMIAFQIDLSVLFIQAPCLQRWTA